MKSFLGVRSGIGVEDRVSVFIYNSSSRFFWDAKPLFECSREVDTLLNAFQSGGTCFSRAFEKTLEVLQSPEGSSTSLRTNSPRLRPGSAKDRATQEMKLSWPRRPVCGELVLAAVVDAFLAEFGVLSLPSIYSNSGLPNQGFLELHYGSRPLWPTIHQASDTPSAFKRRDLAVSVKS